MGTNLTSGNIKQLETELSKIKFSLVRASASPEHVSQKVVELVDLWIADAVEDAVHGSKTAYSVKEKAPAREKLEQIHHYLDRMRAMFEEHYEENEDAPEILLANLEAELRNIDQEELRP
jgi:hypothetical protein